MTFFLTWLAPGAGESGKSTVLKQIKILYQGGYSEAERDSYREIIWSNTVQSMQVLLRGLSTLNPPISTEGDAELEKNVEYVLGLSPQSDDFNFSKEVAKAIGFLWAHPIVLSCYYRSSELQLNDSAS